MLPNKLYINSNNKNSIFIWTLGRNRTCQESNWKEKLPRKCEFSYLGYIQGTRLALVWITGWFFFLSSSALPLSTMLRMLQFNLIVIMANVLAHSSEWVSTVAQSCPTLCDPMDCSLPGSSVHGIFQTRILEWVAISFSRRSSRPRDWTQVSYIIGRCFTIWVNLSF